MTNGRGFSFQRLWAIVVKEFIQMRRDRLTFAMMIGIPLIQLILFSFAINTDPKHLSAAVLLADRGPQGRALLSALKNSSYFQFVRQVQTESEAHDALARGEVQFLINIPESFTRDLLRGDRPTLLVEADATDPGATGGPLGALPSIINAALLNDAKGVLDYLATADGPIDLRVHAKYNPEAITQYTIVPGLLGVVLTMTMVMITSLAITRERESGTMENLLSMPTRPLEVMIGKIVPYILVGYIQMALILAVSHYMFHVPMLGNIFLMMCVTLVFIAASLAVGVTFSTLAQNQRQAMQMTMFFFLPSILLSGFMFPFRGMPEWAQAIGEILPLTHFLRLVRGILLKGNGLEDVIRQLWQIALFGVVVLIIAVLRYRKTLD
ncbi:MAG: ABC-type multidrug transport system, permease component [Planctomycetaceae bacterium]|nr:ABC-type multidrug transport system, permease component [Planctomycetaceae bacterium]